MWKVNFLLCEIKTILLFVGNLLFSLFVKAAQCFSCGGQAHHEQPG